MIKKLNKIKHYLYLGIIILTLLGLSVYLLIAVVNAKTVGTEIGNTVGEFVGTAKGSLLAVGDAEEFFNAGVEQGISAEDTIIKEIHKKFNNNNSITILSVNVTIEDMLEIGEKYKAWILWPGIVNYNIAWDQTTIVHDEEADVLYVTIPEPTVELILDSPNKKIIAKSEEFNINSADKGNTVLINSENKIIENVKDYISNYESLMEVAKDSAQTQIKEFVESLSFSNEVVVVFSGGEQ